MSVNSIDERPDELEEDACCGVLLAAEQRYTYYGGQPAEYCGDEAVTVVDGEPRCEAHRCDNEPDWESIAEARAEARAEAEMERAESSYDRWVYGD